MGFIGMEKQRLRNRSSARANFPDIVTIIFLCAALLLQGLITPLVFYQSQKIVTSAGLPDTRVVKQVLGFRLWEATLQSELYENESLSGYELRTATGRNVRDYRRLINVVYSVAIVFLFGYGILLGIRLGTVLRKAYCKSILALSIGGHAPPLVSAGSYE